MTDKIHYNSIGQPYPPKLLHEVKGVTYLICGTHRTENGLLHDVKNLETGVLKEMVSRGTVNKWFNIKQMAIKAIKPYKKFFIN